MLIPRPQRPGDIRLDWARVPSLITIPLAAFVPLNLDWLLEAFRFVAHPGTAPVPHFWEPTPIQDFLAVTHADAEHPARLMLTLAAPIALCWLISRSSIRTAEFAIAYIGILLFANMFNHPGTSRHNGIVFLAFIASTWRSFFWRYRSLSLWLFRTLVAVGALGGILTLSSELLPFSKRVIRPNGLRRVILQMPSSLDQRTS